MRRRAASCAPRPAVPCSPRSRQRGALRRADRASRLSPPSGRQCARDNGSGDEISPYARLTGDRLARLERERITEHRSGVDARMELAVFAAWIDPGRQITEQLAVELAAGE